VLPVAVAHPELAPLSRCVLTLTGAKQGVFKGSIEPNNGISISAVTHDIVNPPSATGQATGKRQHQPIVVTKTVDQTSPQFYLALANNEGLPSVTLNLQETGADGTTATIYTIQLKNAMIAGIELSVPDLETPLADGTKPHAIERVSFAYQSISWTWNAGGGAVVAQDVWGAPGV
jgi:type VI secretion system secreted protein Hcp